MSINFGENRGRLLVEWLKYVVLDKKGNEFYPFPFR